MAQNYWIAIISWSTCAVVTIAISLVTKPKTDEELHNLVYGVTEMPPKGECALVQAAGSAGDCGDCGFGGGEFTFLVARKERRMDDLRRPTGYLFTLLGLILLAYGLIRPEVRAALDA